MRKLSLIVAILSLGAFAFGQQNYAPNTLTPSCNAVTGTGACTALYLSGNSVPIGVSWQLNFDTGTASAINVTLRGSNDNSLWTVVDTSTSTGNSSRSLVVGTYKYLDCNVVTYTKGTTNNLTCSITSNPNGAPGGEGIISINSDTTSAQQIVGAGTVSCSTTGGVTTCTGTGGTNFSTGELPSGLINSSNTTYTLAHTPTSGSLALYQNGIRLTVSQDYTISTGTITMTTAPTTGDVLVADYRY